MNMIDRIAGIYQIKQKLGEGMMGEVFKGINTQTNETVALKLVSPYE